MGGKVQFECYYLHLDTPFYPPFYCKKACSFFSFLFIFGGFLEKSMKIV